VVRFERADRPFAPPLPDPGAHAALVRLVRQLRPDVVHAHSWLGASLPRRHRPPTVLTAHDYALACQLHTLLRTDGTLCPGPSFATCVRCGSRSYGAARSLAMTSATIAGRRALSVDHLLTLSEQVRRVVGPLLPVPVEVITGFVRGGAPEVLPAGLPMEPYVMYAGDPGPHKGLDQLLALWRSPSPPPAPLLVASTKEVPPPLPSHVTVLNLDREQVRAAWRGALLAVVPSRWQEPFGMVVLEALTAGVPVVASRVGALPELIRENVDGLLVAPAESGALHAAVTGLLRDEATRAAMASEARNGSIRFAADAVLPRVEAVYERVIATPRGTL
jgi:glycosyltransferase involved in cell wall biosynthesis